MVYSTVSMLLSVFDISLYFVIPDILFNYKHMILTFVIKGKPVSDRLVSIN